VNDRAREWNGESSSHPAGSRARKL
jgi:hypothetical protein